MKLLQKFVLHFPGIYGSEKSFFFSTRTVKLFSLLSIKIVSNQPNTIKLYTQKYHTFPPKF